MHEIVSQFIEKKNVEKRAVFEKAKAKALIDLGIYEKEFPPDPQNVDYNEYDCGFYDDATGTYKRYKRVPVEVSDEEYEEILKCSGADLAEENGGSNTIGSILQLFAWMVIIGGFIMGFANGFVYDEFIFGIAIIYWVCSFFAGFSLLAFAEILVILQKIYNNTKK